MDIREIQNEQLDTLKDIMGVCKKYDLRCFLYCGTLLGAVRHKGFIPWDDDVDLVMPVADYRRFLPLFETEMGDKYRVTNFRNDPKFHYLWTRVTRRNTTYTTEEKIDFDMDWGIPTDVYPMIGAFDSPAKYKLQKFLIKMSDILIRKDWMVFRKFRYRSWKKIDYLTYLVPRPMRHGFANLVEKYMWPDPESTKMVGSIDSAPFEAKYQREQWHKIIQGEFEGYLFDIPAEYDALLRRMYGDYMQLPPMEKRVKHQEGNVIFSTDKEYREIRKEMSDAKSK